MSAREPGPTAPQPEGQSGAQAGNPDMTQKPGAPQREPVRRTPAGEAGELHGVDEPAGSRGAT